MAMMTTCGTESLDLGDQLEAFGIAGRQVQEQDVGESDE